ncbi:helix-turn-helix domain-containing protein [Halotia wernerae UHCC 0503]|nr:helix-turn-helix domain-containing protein [Halotia wernerae UHCC 0503]
MNNPRILQAREQNLIDYSNCQLGMSPQSFYTKWDVNHEAMSSDKPLRVYAWICDHSLLTVRRWFSKGRNYRRPILCDLHHLALMDFLLEHFEEIPEDFLKMLCFPNPRK